MILMSSAVKSVYSSVFHHVLQL